MIFFATHRSKRPSRAQNASSLKSHVALLVSSGLWVWGTLMGLKEVTSYGQCAGTRGCRRGKGPQPQWAMNHRPASSVFLGWPDCRAASDLPGRVCVCVCHTLSGPRLTHSSLFHLHAGDWACWRSRECVDLTRWTVPLWSLMLAVL